MNICQAADTYYSTWISEHLTAFNVWHLVANHRKQMAWSSLQKWKGANVQSCGMGIEPNAKYGEIWGSQFLNLQRPPIVSHELALCSMAFCHQFRINSVKQQIQVLVYYILRPILTLVMLQHAATPKSMHAIVMVGYLKANNGQVKDISTYLCISLQANYAFPQASASHFGGVCSRR